MRQSGRVAATETYVQALLVDKQKPHYGTLTAPARIQIIK